MSRYKLLFGVCGIGRGHTYRQFPLIKHYATSNQIGIFAYGESYNFYSHHFKTNKNIHIFRVEVPWIQGGINGIDYYKTAHNKSNLNPNYTLANFNAMSDFLKTLGKPDLIISDYEPTSAQFAYSLNVKLITIDQESKFFYKGFPEKFGALSIHEETARLSMFFPKANKRIACSFFVPPSRKTNTFKIKIVHPVIRDEIIKIKSNENNVDPRKILVYLSPYSPIQQSAKEVLSILSEFHENTFFLYISQKSDFIKYINDKFSNLKIFLHGDRNYLKKLRQANAAICTSGHTFVSEMMYINKPIYTIPLQTYDQNYNATFIAENKFGVKNPKIEKKALEEFLITIPEFKKNIIKNHHRILLNDAIGQTKIIMDINSLLAKK